MKTRELLKIIRHLDEMALRDRNAQKMGFVTQRFAATLEACSQDLRTLIPDQEITLEPDSPEDPR